MLDELQAYYHKNGISAQNFHCPFYSSCAQSSLTSFTTAKEAFVSSGYEQHVLPRILFLSLDSGSASTDPAEKRLENIRRQEEIEQQVLALPHNKHWFRTHELAYMLLRNFSSGLKLEEAKHYFAHTNSAKCCQNNAGRGQAHSTLFENCRRFIPGEIEILAPDVLITQGDYAKLAVEEAFMIIDPVALSGVIDLPDEVRFISLSGKPVIWIHTFHPRNPNSKRNRDNYPTYEKLVFEFLTNRLLVQTPPARGGIPVSAKPRLQKPRLPAAPVSDLNGLNYVFLDSEPQTPAQKSPGRENCASYEFMSMVQLCNIAEDHGLTRSTACNAFGGDRGKYQVEPARMSRALMVGNKLRKYVLVSAVAEYFAEHGVNW